MVAKELAEQQTEALRPLTRLTGVLVVAAVVAQTELQATRLLAALVSWVVVVEVAPDTRQLLAATTTAVPAESAETE